MIRSLSLAAVLAMGLSLPALAGEEAVNASDTTAVTEYMAELSKAANANQVRELLVAKGYTNVTGLVRDEQGRWTGAAVRDGKSVMVSVALPAKSDAPAAN